MSVRLAWPASIVLCALAGAVTGAQQPADPIVGVESAILAEMTRAGIPGAAIAVVVGDRVWTRGFGVASVETETPVTPDTLFQIGSVTKVFTAAAILTAGDALALDAPVSRYVPGLAPCVGAPTLRQLLSHTGGLIDEPAEFGPQGEDGLGAYQRTWTSEYCLLPPGRAFSYSNSGFALAGLALQEVDKARFADAMKARVLAPLGMTRTTFRPTEAMTWPLAVGHRRAPDGRVEVVRPLANDARLWPAGTLYSSAREMARFVVALMHDGRIDGKQALPAGLVASLRGEVVGIPTTGQAYGQGLFLDRAAGEFGHGGSMTGYVSQFTVADHDDAGRAPAVGVAVLTNGDGVNPEPLLRAAMNAARASASGTRAPTARHGETPPTRALTAAQAAPFVGTYRNPRRFTVEVVRDGETLALRRFGRDVPMRALEADGEFVVDVPGGGTERIAFGRGPDGRAEYLQMYVWMLARVAVP